VQDDILKQAFNLFDIDGNGTISKKELQRVLGGVFIMSEEQLEEFIKELDTSGNG
jgi:Ca2+-binding EF-hand superfamily protein